MDRVSWSCLPDIRVGRDQAPVCHGRTPAARLVVSWPEVFTTPQWRMHIRAGTEVMPRDGVNDLSRRPARPPALSPMG